MNFDDLGDYFFDDTDLVVQATIETITGTKDAIPVSSDGSNYIYSDNGLVVNIDSSYKLKVADFASVDAIRALNQKKFTVGGKIYRIAKIEIDSQAVTWKAMLEAKFK